MLFQEISLTDKFLMLDDRNFHCWNYRITIFKMIYEYFPDKFWQFLNNELTFTINMIKKSFSNFSSWHYRTLLIPVYFEKERLDWNSESVLNYFKTDLEYITNAIYTDPKDQSSWNYHQWILKNLIPIYVEDISIIEGENVSLKIKFSEIFDMEDLIEIESDVEGLPQIIKSTFTTGNSNRYCDTLIINLYRLNNEHVSFTIKNKNLEKFENLKLSLNNTICFSTYNLTIPDIKIIYFKSTAGNNVSYQIDTSYFKNIHLELLNNQLKIIDNLIQSSEGFLEYAHYRKVQILTIIYHNHNKEVKTTILEELEKLSQNSKRMSCMYKQFITGWERK